MTPWLPCAAVPDDRIVVSFATLSEYEAFVKKLANPQEAECVACAAMRCVHDW
jgi:hypothetical protein